MSTPDRTSADAQRGATIRAAAGADQALEAHEQGEVSPLRRREPEPEPAPWAVAVQDPVTSSPGREHRNGVDGLAGAPRRDRGDDVDDPAMRASRAGRPIQRDDVYRHPMIGGHERPDTPWRRAGLALRELVKGKAQREEEQLDARLRRPAVVSRMNVIAVLSPKGGVGKTTTTYLVGDALASLGRVNVLALDANPDYGTLGALVPGARRSERNLSDLLREYPEGTSPPNAAQLQPYLSSLESGLRVLEAPPDIDVMADMGAMEYGRLVELVRNQIAVTVLDCGTGLASPLARWAMRTADQVLIVTTPDWVTANNVSAALKHVPADKATLVLNQVRKGVAGDRSAISDHFAAQSVARRHVVPYDEALRTMLDSGTHEMDQVRRSTRLPIKRLSAQVGEELL